MRMSDWSSDVCSSDLEDLGLHRIGRLRIQLLLQEHGNAHRQRPDADVEDIEDAQLRRIPRKEAEAVQKGGGIGRGEIVDPAVERRSEERRVGKEGGRTCRSRWSRYT